MSIKNGLSHTHRNFAASLMAAAMTLSLASTVLMFGTQKAKTAPSEGPTASSVGKKARNCPQKTSLPLNMGRRPAPPAPANFLGMARATFGELGGSSQWCWASTCSHIEMACSEGRASDMNGCCVQCCNEFGCSEGVCCPCIGC